MRTMRLLPVGLALLAGVLGCSRTINYTAGICDCNPPNVESVLVPPARPVPFGAHQMPPGHVSTSEMPHVTIVSKPDKLPTVTQPSLGTHFPEKVPPLVSLPATPNDALPR